MLFACLLGSQEESGERGLLWKLFYFSCCGVVVITKRGVFEYDLVLVLHMVHVGEGRLSTAL
jgi:hypothetical protein